jgi:hypothetical protein
VTLTKILHEIYLRPKAVSANFSREKASSIAALASSGYISTKEARYVYGRLWRVTALGYELLVEECLI